MIIYLYIDAKRARMPTREEQPIRGAGEVSAAATTVDDWWLCNLRVLVLKLKLTTLEDEPSTEAPFDKTPSPAPPTSAAAIPKTAEPTNKKEVKEPTKARTTPAAIKLELVPVTTGEGKQGDVADPSGEGVRVETIADKKSDAVEGKAVESARGGTEALTGKPDDDVGVVKAENGTTESSRQAAPGGVKEIAGTKTENMADIMKRLEKLEAEVGAKTGTPRKEASDV
ncbi:hypothetical protein FOL47_002344 [Perkinsus chesapeaki]|uniref:Uncharacterized protein n=1 Tax=Perkinsus chesapeaki TaxID=330153 RepID=A0A7J6ME20_PERCH|nr:hypothetical protein FOL47_002344 [Perkinsus chesapeaki]